MVLHFFVDLHRWQYVKLIIPLEAHQRPYDIKVKDYYLFYGINDMVIKYAVLLLSLLIFINITFILLY